MKILNNNQCKKFVDLAVEKLAKYLVENKLSGVTTGISGGIDSAVVAVIGIKTIERLHNQGYKASYKYLFLDCENDPADYQRVEKLSLQFNIKLEQINLTAWFRSSPLLKLIPPNYSKAKIARGNMKARLRMIALYQNAFLNNYIYLDTGDLSEHWMGFWTRHGDEGDVKIINGLTKTEVYDLGEYLDLPSTILSSPPGDGLKVTKGSLASEQLGLSYMYIEYIISRFLGNNFDINGSLNQLKSKKFNELIKKVADEINKPVDSIKKILIQALKTAYKRKYGDYAPHLLPERKEFGFLEIGSKELNQKYFDRFRRS